MNNINIIYSSQTGTAEELAFKIFSNLSYRYKDVISVSITSADMVDINVLPLQNVVIFLVSTTGDGDFPDTMMNLWKFLLKKSLPRDSLTSMGNIVFGLGDSSYEKFNTPARKLSLRLKQLGSTEVMPLTLADDQAKFAYLSAFEPFLLKLTTAIDNKFAVSYVSEFDEKSLLTESKPNLYQVNSFSNMNEYVRDFYSSFPKPRNIIRVHDTDSILNGKIIDNSRLTSYDWNQDVRNIRVEYIDASDSDIKCVPWYNPGDIATIYPQNPSSLVLRMIEILPYLQYGDRFQPHDLIEIKPCGFKNSESPLRYVYRSTRIASVTCTVVELFTNILDLAGIPQRSFIEGMIPYATSDEERDKLLELSSTQGIDLYFDYCIREKRNYVEFFEDFKSCRPPLEKIIEHISVIKPRHYSIASYDIDSPNQVEICVALHRSKTRYGRTREGLCSHYLANLAAGDKLKLYLTSGLIQNPKIESPLILIGPGTGIAPLRSVMQYRLCKWSQIPRIGDVFLFFGCRKKDSDYLYRQEWEGIFKNNQALSEKSSPNDPDYFHHEFASVGDEKSIFSMTVAFSRDPKTVSDSIASSKSNYVTNKIDIHGKYLWELISVHNAQVIISGSAKQMPKDVKKAFKRIFTEFGGISESECDHYIDNLAKQKRYVVEAWS